MTDGAAARRAGSLLGRSFYLPRLGVESVCLGQLPGVVGGESLQRRRYSTSRRVGRAVVGLAVDLFPKLGQLLLPTQCGGPISVAGMLEGQPFQQGPGFAASLLKSLFAVSTSRLYGEKAASHGKPFLGRRHRLIEFASVDELREFPSQAIFVGRQFSPRLLEGRFVGLAWNRRGDCQVRQQPTTR